MKIALLSPKGPLYRNRGGIFKKSLRYQPLTLTTLAALAPPELDAEFALYDEGIGDVPLDLDADLVGITVITGSSPRGYELARHFRARGIPVVLGGPHVTLMPEEAMRHADAVCVGYAEETWPQLLRDFAAGRMQRRYDQGHDFALTNLPFPRRDLLDGRHFLTQAVFEATRACAHDCEFCVVPTAWGRSQFQKPVGHVVEDIRRVGKRRIIFIDLNLISDRAYAMELFEALVPLEGALVRPGHQPDRPRRRADATDGEERLRRPADRAREHLRRQPARHPQALQRPLALSHADRRPARARHQRAGLLRVRQRPRRHRRLRPHRAVRDRRRHRPAALRHPHPVPGHAAARAARPRRPHPDQELGALRRPARGVPPQADDAAASCRRATSGRGARSTRTARSCAGWRRRARNCRSP